MTSQLCMDFVAAPMARRRDPITSHQAAAQARELAARHQALILGVLRAHGPLGKDGIASRLRGLDGAAVGRRLTDLSRLGLIVETGRVVKSTAGRNEREWRVA